VPKKKTPAQKFADIFRQFTSGATPWVRTTAESKMDEWLKRHAKTRVDIPLILAEAVADDAASQPPPPQPDPRDTGINPLNDPTFTPADLVERIVARYVWMPPHLMVIFRLCICLAHVYRRFRITPRVAFVSEEPDSGKSTALDVARPLVFRPNPEALGSAAAIIDFLDEGPGTVLLDELDQVDADARKHLLKLWNLGHKRGTTISLKIGRRRKEYSIYAPMFAAGLGSFLAAAQTSRAFIIDMRPYTEETKPEREFDEEDLGDFDKVYTYLHHWAAKVKLNPKPAMPAGRLRRAVDNVKGILAIADSCGEEWGRRAREAVTILLEKEKAEQPKTLILLHTLLIIDMLELDPIPSQTVNKELLRLDLPEARWNRYRGPSGGDYAHPLRLDEQAALMRSSEVTSKLIKPPGKKPFHGYRREWIVEALARKRGTPAPPRLPNFG
jgi:Protein of unknown function (DUF3631)